jgi:polyisoprenoid-binding protein YceI
MKKVLFPIAAVLIVLASAFTYLAAQNYKIADGYSIKFSAGGTEGIFKTLKGDISFDEKNLASSKFNVTVDVASVNTGNALKNTHVKGGNWMEAKKYPEIKFTSKEIVKSGSGYTAKGDLEMHGVKKEISIPFTFAKSGNGGTFNGSFSVNRTDYGIGSPGGKVDDIIKLTVSVPVN